VGEVFDEGLLDAEDAVGTQKLVAAPEDVCHECPELVANGWIYEYAPEGASATERGSRRR
jgi:hypothetical protein